MKDIGETDVILGIRIKCKSNSLTITQSHYIEKNIKKFDSEGGDAISWAYKKQTCITDSIMESEFIALAAARKEAEWLEAEFNVESLQLMIGTHCVIPRNYSSTEQINSIQQMIAYYIMTGIKVEIGEIIYNDLVTKLTNKNFGSLPSILSNSNFSKDPSKVIEIELTALMIVVNNIESLVSPLPFSRKKKKEQSQNVSKPKPRTQGLEASRTLSQKRKKAKIDKTTPKATKTPPTEDVPMEDYKKTHSVSSSQTDHPQDTEGNIQPAHVDKGLPSKVPDEGTSKPKPLSKGPHEDKDSEGFKPSVNMKPSTTPVADLSGDDAKYQANQTQLSRLRYRFLTKNKGKTSSKVEPDTQTLLLTTAADVQALLFSNDDLAKSKDDVFEAGDEMDEDIHYTNKEETQSPSPNKEQPESSHA
ncbi:hypothetical protein Tco_0611827 [Tanacetum coccineum]